MLDRGMDNLFKEAVIHREQHGCGGYPYEHADMLRLFIMLKKPFKILELGTGLGYTSAVMAKSSKDIQIDTLDQDETHVELAKRSWQTLGVTSQITPHIGKAEDVLPKLTGEYDLIFFDGYSPSMKFFTQFERLLKKNGILVTANMFLKDERGGKYMRALSQKHRWQLGVFADTTVAIKLFQ